jgi:hydroxymethylpyrimidine pyrophosphatase-like HAD family hydrolase
VPWYREIEDPLAAVNIHVFATDYDGTIAEHNRVDAATARALQRVRATGRKLLLVTGRMLPDLQ